MPRNVSRGTNLTSQRGVSHSHPYTLPYIIPLQPPCASIFSLQLLRRTPPFVSPSSPSTHFSGHGKRKESGNMVFSPPGGISAAVGVQNETAAQKYSLGSFRIFTAGKKSGFPVGYLISGLSGYRGMNDGLTDNLPSPPIALVCLERREPPVPD